MLTSGRASKVRVVFWPTFTLAASTSLREISAISCLVIRVARTVLEETESPFLALPTSAITPSKGARI